MKSATAQNTAAVTAVKTDAEDVTMANVRDAQAFSTKEDVNATFCKISF